MFVCGWRLVPNLSVSYSLASKAVQRQNRLAPQAAFVLCYLHLYIHTHTYIYKNDALTHIAPRYVSIITVCMHVFAMYKYIYILVNGNI